jgi:hypothetical protein
MQSGMYISLITMVFTSGKLVHGQTFRRALSLQSISTTRIYCKMNAPTTMLPLLSHMKIPIGPSASKPGAPSVGSVSSSLVARMRRKLNSNQQLPFYQQRWISRPPLTLVKCALLSEALFGILTFPKRQLQLHTRTMMAVPPWTMPRNQPHTLVNLTLSFLPFATGLNRILFFWK